MRLRWLLIGAFAVAAAPSADACDEHLAVVLDAALDPDGDTLAVTVTNTAAEPLWLDTHADTRELRALRVELSQAGVAYASVSSEQRRTDQIRTVRLAPGDTFVQRIDLQTRAATLHCGVFDIQVTLFGGATFELPARTIALAGCEWMPATVGPQPKQLPVPSDPSPWPRAVLVGLLCVTAWLTKRAGTPVGCVPC